MATRPVSVLSLRAGATIADRYLVLGKFNGKFALMGIILLFLKTSPQIFSDRGHSLQANLKCLISVMAVNSIGGSERPQTAEAVNLAGGIEERPRRKTLTSLAQQP
ncbi:hypothetical protein RB195_005431 [Necator americanus]|uniref:Uncharacterized protein n=1 Tax=Necator americanus TaxID=51031 RepID=A0ABR1BRN6_NECAM